MTEITSAISLGYTKNTENNSVRVDGKGIINYERQKCHIPNQLNVTIIGDEDNMNQKYADNCKTCDHKNTITLKGLNLEIIVA
ncbi:MAG: hypothetical protein AABW50_01785 [Nanoarchaeota archaeon]